ncbi:hypothetical protein CKA32_003125 [Geitlerinema sp. FC II]|nr:hypothetical protein CKA32_003125 [Geitlerinema sp. FC II]
MYLKTLNLSDRSLCRELSCCWVERSLHPWTAALPKSNLPQTHIWVFKV